MKRKNCSTDEDQKRLSRLLFPENFAEKIGLTDESISKQEENPPAWIDEDDDLFRANKVLDTKNKDLYVNTLKQKYVNLMGTPNWARLKKKIKKENEDNDEILRTVGHLKKRTSNTLLKDYLDVKMFPKINSETNNEGPIITCVEFHPTASVALVGGQSGVISLFSIGGDTNNKLHSFRLKRFSNVSAHFTPDGAQALIATKQNHSFCIYDLVKAEPLLVDLPRVVKRPTIFELSPDGKYLAASDGFEELSLICTKSRELLKTLKHNYNVISVVFGKNNDKIYALGASGEVSIWNLTTFRIENKFFDQGCVNASCMTTSMCGRLMAIGSNEGIVNVYELDNMNTVYPMPIKCIENLRTKITNLKFNCSKEILGITSSYYPNAVKLIHIPSYHVFANFPGNITNLYQVGPLSFSPNSGFMALGNNKKSAYIFRLKHYKNY